MTLLELWRGFKAMFAPDTDSAPVDAEVFHGKRPAKRKRPPSKATPRKRSASAPAKRKKTARKRSS